MDDDARTTNGVYLILLGIKGHNTHSWNGALVWTMMNADRMVQAQRMAHAARYSNLNSNLIVTS